MNIKYLIYSVILLLITNCSTQKNTSINGEVKININEKVKLGHSKTTISFDEIQEDSRCPKDVTCVWQGIATVKVSITENGKKEEFLISNLDLEDDNRKKSFNYNGYTFIFSELKPEPGAENDPASLTIRIKKLQD